MKSTLPDQGPTDAQLALAEEQAKDDLKWLMANAQGRRFAWRLLEQAGVYRTSFHSSGSVTAFNEGRRDIGLRLLAEIHEHEPDAFLLMLKECR